MQKLLRRGILLQQRGPHPRSKSLQKRRLPLLPQTLPRQEQRRSSITNAKFNVIMSVSNIVSFLRLHIQNRDGEERGWSVGGAKGMDCRRGKGRWCVGGARGMVCWRPVRVSRLDRLGVRAFRRAENLALGAGKAKTIYANWSIKMQERIQGHGGRRKRRRCGRLF